MDANRSAGEPGVTSGGAPVRIAGVALTVRDMDAVTAFYRDAVGLALVEDRGEVRTLGAGSRAFLELRHDPAARRDDPRSAGLFHTAFLLPARSDLANWLDHARASGLRLDGASDHLVSEAVYLTDPEGNGVEIYADRPSTAWTRRGGLVEMATAPLDLEDLADTRSGRWAGAPGGTMVGHVHLRVGDLEPAEAFYAGALGLDVQCRYPGATFFGSGGYHHHVAGNIWRSRGAPVRTAGSTGLAEVRLAAEPMEFEAVRRRRLPKQPEASTELGLRDPWGTEIVLQRA